MSEIPEAFTGGWVRAGISLDGGPFREDATVWWLQASAAHADLRISEDPAAPATCFAGVTTWDGTALTWTRRVDLEDYTGVDSGIATWDGDDLLESGTITSPDGTTTTYVERWVRLPESSGPLWAQERDGLHAVRTGGYALTISDDRPAGGTFRGTAWMWSGDRWTVHHTLTDVPLAPRPSDIWALR